MKMVYVISSLNKSGPVEVLYNIAKYIVTNKENHVSVITIKKTNHSDMIKAFEDIGVKCISLELGTIETLYKGRRKLHSMLVKIKPDIVHAQCFRSVLLLSLIKGTWFSYATIHCYPHIDFVYAYGSLLGRLMTKLYVAALRKINYPVACSNAIADEMKKMFELDVLVVLNGVSNCTATNIDLDQYKSTPKQKVLLCVACFNKRKNQKAILRSFSSLLEKNKIAIIFLGDGEYKIECQQFHIPNTFFLGNVNNVYDYYDKADGLISSSIAEGMPMSVLEALVSGVPRFILSDIQPHRELKSMFPHEVMLLDFNEVTRERLDNCYNFLLEKHNRKDIKQMAEDKVSARKMADGYMKLYKGGIKDCYM